MSAEDRKTYRERREARAERLRGWAEKREAKADSMHASGDLREEASGIPFGQPILVGHHSERRHRNAIEKANNATRRALENDAKAASMRSRADNIERAAEHAIYSDDADAVERLREKIASLEARREAMKQRNAEYRKAHKAELKALSSAYQRDRAMPHQAYELQNLGGNISRARKRLAQLVG